MSRLKWWVVEDDVFGPHTFFFIPVISRGVVEFRLSFHTFYLNSTIYYCFQVNLWQKDWALYSQKGDLWTSPELIRSDTWPKMVHKPFFLLVQKCQLYQICLRTATFYWHMSTSNWCMERHDICSGWCSQKKPILTILTKPKNHGISNTYTPPAQKIFFVHFFHFLDFSGLCFFFRPCVKV